MKKAVCCITIASCIAFTIPLAWAEDKGMSRRSTFAENVFKEMDANGDGFVSREEFTAFYNKRFDAIDTNNDGKISHEEMEAVREKAMRKFGERMQEQFNRLFDEADTNHDGALSKEEAKKMPRVAQHFDEIDANHNGKVTREEINAYMQKMRGKNGMMHPDGKAKEGGTGK